MANEIPLQSFQRGPPTGRILQVEALYHPDSNQHIVFWDDILEAFPGATSVLNGNVVVTRARDAAFRFIEPRCIKYQAEKVLEVVGGEDLGTLSGSTFALTPAPGQLTFKNIEQWAAMIAPEDTLLGGRYAPTICTLTTTKTRPFKPLMVPTEADASSMREDSATASEEEAEHNDDREVTQEEEQEEEQEVGEEHEQGLTVLANETAIAMIADMPKVYTTGSHPSNPLNSPPSPRPLDRNRSNAVYAPQPPTIITDTDTVINSEYEYQPSNSSSITAFNPYNNDYSSFSSGSNGSSSGGLISPTSPSSISTTYISPAQLPPQLSPAAKAPKKPGFLKSTFNRLSGRTPAKPVSTEAASQELSFYTHYPLLPQRPLAGGGEPVIFKPDPNWCSMRDAVEEEEKAYLAKLYRKVEEEKAQRLRELRR